MQKLKNRIEFYKQRNFTEKLNATFDFIRENLSVLLRYSFYVIMPICLIQTFAINSIYGAYLNLGLQKSIESSPLTEGLGFFADFGIIILCFLLGSSLISGLVYALMQTYNIRENRLNDVVFRDFSKLLLHNSLRCVALMIFMIIAVIMITITASVFAVSVSALSLFITAPLFIILSLCVLPLMLILPVYLFERDISFFAAFSKAWKLGTGTFWGMLGLMIVLYFISSVIQTVTSLPWTITLAIKAVFSVSNDIGLTQSPIYKFFLYLLGLIQSFGIYASSIIGIIGLAFQYFHAREKIEGVTIESGIDNFSML